MASGGLSRAGAALALGLAIGAGATWLGFAGGHDGRRAMACPAASMAMQRIELVFGLSRKGRVDVSEAEWTQFLAEEVTPRFPEGLTVLAGQGQWRNPAGALVREPSRLLLVWTKAAPDLDARITAIREAWKAAHQQDSVLRADGRSCVSF